MEPSPEAFAPDEGTPSCRLTRLLDAVRRDDDAAIYGEEIDEYTIDREHDLTGNIEAALALATQLGHLRALRALPILGTDPLRERVVTQALSGTTPEALNLLIEGARYCPGRAPHPGACPDPDAIDEHQTPSTRRSVAEHEQRSLELTSFLFEMCTDIREPPKESRLDPWPFDYKRHTEIQCLSGCIKRFCRVFTRYDKTDRMFGAFVAVVFVADQLR